MNQSLTEEEAEFIAALMAMSPDQRAEVYALITRLRAARDRQRDEERPPDPPG